MCMRMRKLSIVRLLIRITYLHMFVSMLKFMLFRVFVCVHGNSTGPIAKYVVCVCVCVCVFLFVIHGKAPKVN